MDERKKLFSCFTFNEGVFSPDASDGYTYVVFSVSDLVNRANDYNKAISAYVYNYRGEIVSCSSSYNNTGEYLTSSYVIKVARSAPYVNDFYKALSDYVNRRAE